MKNQLKKCKCGCGCDKRQFTDTVSIYYDSGTKTVVSMRDGVHEYLGVELGVEPFNKVFQVYRSPTSVLGAAKFLDGLVVTDDHVSTDQPPPNDKIVSSIESTNIQTIEDKTTNSSMVVRNKIANTDSMLKLVEKGNKELSLGFLAKLIPHEKYDFEQTEFEPHHLAVLERGRCGSICKFQDTKPEGVNTVNKFEKLQNAVKSFQDAKVDMTVEQVLELVAALPDAIRNVPMAQLQKIAPALVSIVEAAKESGVEMSEAEASEDAEETETQDGDDAAEGGDADDKAETQDGEGDAAEGGDADEKEDDKTETQDGESGEDDDADDKKSMSDGKTLFNDEKVLAFVDKQIKEHSDVVEKARKFVDEKFNFAGKTTDEIRQEIIKAATGETFTDSSELRMAFKMLKPTKSLYKSFGDSNNVGSQFDNIANKEL